MEGAKPGHDIIVMGASAGGVEALTQLVRDLPPDLLAAVFVVVHVPAYSTSLLPDILNRSGKLPAAHPRDGEAIQSGHIYVAPPNNHLLIKPGHIHLARGPRENSHRPAVDPLFRTAAWVYGKRVVGVVLSGTLDDGTEGLTTIKTQGGIAIVQDPNSALFTGMPCSAIESVEVDYILPLSEIASVLVSLAREPVAAQGVSPVSAEVEMGSDIAELEADRFTGRRKTWNSFRFCLPGVWRCPLGAARRRADSIPLPGGSCLFRQLPQGFY